MEVNLKKKNTGLIAGIAGVVVVLAVILGVVFSSGSKDPLQEQLDLGLKYMQEQNYEQAVAAYLAAIEIDDRCVEAYIGAAKAYEAMGDLDSAVGILTAGLELTGDSELEEALIEIMSGESDSDDTTTDDSGYGEGSVYVVEFEDPELTQIAQEFYQMVVDDPTNPEGYMNLFDMYMGLDKVDAAIDVAKAGYNKTGEEFFKEAIDWVENGGGEGSNDDSNDDVVVEEEEPEIPDNTFIVGGQGSEYYLVTYDPNYIEPRKKGKIGWIHFDGNGVQINFNKQNYASFEDYFTAEKENFDFLIEDNYITDLELGTPVQVQCGNVTAYYYEYSYIDCSDKVVEPTEYRTQEFYVQLGDGVGISGYTDKFLDGYLFTAVGEESRTITMEDYLKYVFVNVEKIEPTYQ